MSQTTACPNCALTMTVPPEAAGRKLRCPECKSTFTAPGEVLSLDDAEPPDPPPRPAPKPPPQPANPFAFDTAPDRDRDDDDRPRRRSSRDRDDDDDDDDRRERRGSSRYSRPKNNTAAVVGVLVAVVVAVGVTVGLKFALSGGPAAIPDSKWQTVEVPGFMKAKLPGSPNIQSMNAAGVGMTMRLVTPDEDSMYALAYSEDDLPPHRRGLPTETLLNDACTGSVQGVAKEGGREISREPVSLGPYPGKELVIDVPKGKGKIVSRVYLVNGRVVMLMAGGRGMEPDNANAKKLFASLEILAPPAGGKPK